MKLKNDHKQSNYGVYIVLITTFFFLLAAEFLFKNIDDKKGGEKEIQKSVIVKSDHLLIKKDEDIKIVIDSKNQANKYEREYRSRERPTRDR